MKVSTIRKVNFFEVNADLKMRPRPLVNLLQEAAMIHSRRAGYETPDLMKKGRAWILHRMGIGINVFPVFGDEVEILTWHRGSKRFRSYRDFRILKNGRELVSATSLWLFIDLERKKILKAPEDAAETYTVEPEAATAIDIDMWRPENGFDPEFEISIPTRPSDYDPLGHVNNALYFDYLETLCDRFLGSPCGMRRILIQFNREISGDVHSVRAGLKREKQGYIFKISSDAGDNAVGEIV